MFDRTAAIHLIEQSRCPCGSCPGPLTDPTLSKGGWAFCRICRCAWQITAPDGQVYAATVPSARHIDPP